MRTFSIAQPQVSAAARVTTAAVEFSAFSRAFALEADIVLIRSRTTPPLEETSTLVAAEDRLWEQCRHDKVRRVDHIGYAKIDGNAAEDISLLPAKPSLLQ